MHLCTGGCQRPGRFRQAGARRHHVIDYDDDQPGQRRASSHRAGEVGTAAAGRQTGLIRHRADLHEERRHLHRQPGTTQLAGGSAGKAPGVIMTASPHDPPIRGDRHQHQARRGCEQSDGGGQRGAERTDQSQLPPFLVGEQRAAHAAGVGRRSGRPREAGGNRIRRPAAQRSAGRRGQCGRAGRTPAGARLPAASASLRQHEVQQCLEQVANAHASGSAADGLKAGPPPAPVEEAGVVWTDPRTPHQPG